MVVNIYEAKTNLSKLITLLEEGEEIIIAKANKPIAKLIQFKKEIKREPNHLKGKIVYKDDFDSSNKEIQKLFEGIN
jgi:antitoxin (DNA-binding transcriptional repressor) of toxin-antitoxin stability system